MEGHNQINKPTHAKAFINTKHYKKIAYDFWWNERFNNFMERYSLNLCQLVKRIKNVESVLLQCDYGIEMLEYIKETSLTITSFSLVVSYENFTNDTNAQDAWRHWHTLFDAWNTELNTIVTKITNIPVTIL